MGVDEFSAIFKVNKINIIRISCNLSLSSFFPWQIDDAIQYINLGYGAQAPKIVILQCIISLFVCCFYVLGHFYDFNVIFLSYFLGLLHFFKFY